MQKYFQENQERLIELENRLNRETYFSKDTLPGFSDAIVLEFFETSFTTPNRHLYPNLFYWFLIIKQFAATSRAKWTDPTKTEDPLLIQMARIYQQSMDLRGNETVEELEDQQMMTKEQDIMCQYVMSIKFKNDVGEGEKNLNQIIKKNSITLDTQQKDQKDKTIRVSFRSDKEECEKVKNLIAQCSNLQTCEIKRLKKNSTIKGQF